MRPWRETARPEQQPPSDGDWLAYVVAAGRGWGKSWAAANWLAEQAVQNERTHWAVIGPSWRDTRKICFEWNLLRQALTDDEVKSSNLSDLTIRLANGSVIRGFGADGVGAIRGWGPSGAWVSDLACMPKAERVWAGLMSELCFADQPRVFVETTVSPTAPGLPLLHRLRDHRRVIWVEGSTWGNASRLSPGALAELRRRYEGSSEVEGGLPVAS